MLIVIKTEECPDNSVIIPRGAFSYWVIIMSQSIKEG